MNPIKEITLAITTVVVLALSSPVVAQNGSVDGTAALQGWISLDAPPGREHYATDEILLTMPGWKRDALGNLMLRKGSGSPRRVVACALGPSLHLPSLKSQTKVTCGCAKSAQDVSIRSGSSFMKDSDSDLNAQWFSSRCSDR